MNKWLCVAVALTLIVLGSTASAFDTRVMVSSPTEPGTFIGGNDETWPVEVTITSDYLYPNLKWALDLMGPGYSGKAFSATTGPVLMDEDTEAYLALMPGARFNGDGHTRFAATVIGDTGSFLNPFHSKIVARYAGDGDNDVAMYRGDLGIGLTEDVEVGGRYEGTYPDSASCFRDTKNLGPYVTARINKHVSIEPALLWDVTGHNRAPVFQLALNCVNLSFK